MQHKLITAPTFVNAESDDVARLRLAFREVELAVKDILPDNMRSSLILGHLECAAAMAYRGAQQND